MKRTLLLLAALALGLSLSAQQIRTNYRSGGITHISTVPEACRDFEVRVEKVGFEDGSWMYQLFIDLRQKTPFDSSLNEDQRIESLRDHEAIQSDRFLICSVPE